MPEMKRNLKDSVFTYLFSDPKYARELYVYLHPEDTDVQEEEIKLVTKANVLANGQYNDLGLQVRDRLIILMEAQSEFSRNIPLRLLLYLAATYKEYIAEHELYLHSAKAVAIPRAELYVVYTGIKKDVPQVLRLSELCGGTSDVEVTVNVLRGGDDSILGQYVEFCQIADQQRKRYGRTREAIKETIRICQEREVLIPFLASRRKEVIDMMELLFSQEEIWEMGLKEKAREARQQGRQEGRREGRQEGRQKGRKEASALYGALLDLLVPLNRVAELQAAAKDEAKLLALADEFGLTAKFGLKS